MVSDWCTNFVMVPIKRTTLTLKLREYWKIKDAKVDAYLMYLLVFYIENYSNGKI